MLQTFNSSKLASTILLSLCCAATFAQKAVLSTQVPHRVTNGEAIRLAEVAPEEKLHLGINLAIHNQAGLDALLADLYNPQSPNFHHWLQPEEFDARFGPLRSETQTVVDWAKAKGFTVTFLATNGRIVEVEGSAQAVNAAFHVKETKYHDTVLNRDFHAPDREPTTDLPVALLVVDGLDNAEPMINHHHKNPNAGLPALVAASSRNVINDGLAFGPTSVTGSDAHRSSPITNVSGSGPGSTYLPSDMRAAYYGNGNLTGAGQTIGIFSFDGYLPNDLNVYYANTGMTTTIPVANVLTGGYSGACTSPCDDGEQILDMVQVMGMAPGLKQILFYENGTAANTELNQMVTDNKAKVISSSWGGGGFGTSSDTYFQQMAAQGVSYLSATGDDGGFYKSNYSAPSFDPYITQVGGTELVTTGPGGAWTSETGWDGSGGGYWITGMSTSAKIAIPTYQSQAGVVTTANKASATYRNVPDMAAEADYDNPTVSNGVFEEGYGGTSYATPRMAGYIALAIEQQVKNGQTAGFGFLNPALYTAGLSASTATVWHDTTSGSNPAYPAGTPTYYAVAGYDLVTGWGSPNGTGLINDLAGAPAADFSISAPAISVQGRGSYTASDTITVTPFNSFTGTVSFSATGLPTGVTATYTPGTPSSPGAITFATTSAAAVTTATITLTGTSGSLTHTTTFPLTIIKRSDADFTLTANAISINQGGTGTTTFTVTPTGTLQGGISLATSGVPPGVTATLSSTLTTTTFDPSTADVPFMIGLTFNVPGSVTPGTYSVTVTGTSVAGIVHSIAVPLTVTVPPNLLTNGGFETGAFTPWVATTVTGTSAAGLLTTASGIPPHNGNYFVLLEGGAAAGTDTLTQQVAIPAGGNSVAVGIWYWVLTGQTTTTNAIDVMTFSITDTSGNVLKTLGSVSNLNGVNGYWAYVSYDASAYMGQTVVLKINANQAGTTYTDFLLDDISVVEY